MKKGAKNTKVSSEEKFQALQKKVDKLIEEHESKFEEYKLSEDWEMGIDEAGRGPVLGPMVYGTCAWPIKLKKELGDLGFADSKQLTEEQRDQFFALMQKMQNKVLYYEVKVISAEEISNKMLGVKSYKNLNAISFEAAYHLINSLNRDQRINVAHLYVDTVGKASVYQEKLKNDFAGVYPKLQFTVAEKADSKFGIVSAASIGAKVTRDMEIDNFQFPECIIQQNEDNEDFKKLGSGYPADPNTKKWLNKNLDAVMGYPNIVRYSWNTITKIMEDNGIVPEFYTDEEPMLVDKKKSKINKQPLLQRTLNLTYDVEI